MSEETKSEETQTEETPVTQEAPVDAPSDDAVDTAPETAPEAKPEAEPEAAPAADALTDAAAEVVEAAAEVVQEAVETATEAAQAAVEVVEEVASDEAPAEAKEEASLEDDAGKKPRQNKSRDRRKSRAQNVPDVSRELKRLIELATKFPEIGAPLAELATKLGYRNLSDRVLNMGLEEEARGIELFIVAANLARKEGRTQDVLDAVLSGLSDFSSSEENAPDIRTRLLHLVRQGFAVVMFDLEDLQSAPEFTAALGEQFPALREQFGEDPFYLSLLAQTLWFSDREASEKVWEEAVALGEAETTWNARGTWYKEAEKDLARAEGAYRAGLKLLPTSVLLLHNLGQVLTDRAAADGVEDTQKRSWLNEAESLLRQAHRHARRHSMRRHINGNIERVKSMQQKLPREVREVKPPEVGDVLTGRVNNIKEYGAFISLGDGLSGLVHKSELAHEYVQDPRDYVKSGDPIEVKVIDVKPTNGGQGVRISLSRKAILPMPEGQEASANEAKGRPNNNRNNDRQGNNNRGGGGGGGGGRGRGRNNRGGNNRGGNNRGGNNRGGNNNRSGGNNNQKKGDDSGLGSLGELLLAKLEERKNND